MDFKISYSFSSDDLVLIKASLEESLERMKTKGIGPADLEFSNNPERLHGMIISLVNHMIKDMRYGPKRDIMAWHGMGKDKHLMEISKNEATAIIECIEEAYSGKDIPPFLFTDRMIDTSTGIRNYLNALFGYDTPVCLTEERR